MNRRAAFALLGTLLTSTAYAQTPPGMVPYQPCGGELGYVPADHPLASQGMCGTHTTPAPPPEEKPWWDVQPTGVFEVGKVYRHIPYGLVWVITAKTTVEHFNYQTLQIERQASMVVVIYQSEDLYRLRTGGHVGTATDDTNIWGWTEIAR